MYCAFCGHSLTEGGRFCPACGKEQAPAAEPAAPPRASLSAPPKAAPGAPGKPGRRVVWIAVGVCSIALLAAVTAWAFHWPPAIFGASSGTYRNARIDLRLSYANVKDKDHYDPVASLKGMVGRSDVDLMSPSWQIRTLTPTPVPELPITGSVGDDKVRIIGRSSIGGHETQFSGLVGGERVFIRVSVGDEEEAAEEGLSKWSWSSEVAGTLGGTALRGSGTLGAIEDAAAGTPSFGYTAKGNYGDESFHLYATPAFETKPVGISLDVQLGSGNTMKLVITPPAKYAFESSVWTCSGTAAGGDTEIATLLAALTVAAFELPQGGL